MRVNSLGDIIEEVIKTPENKDKVDILRRNDHPGLRSILLLAFNDFEWVLSKGTPRYTPCPHLDCEGVLYNELKRIYLFLKDGNDDLEPARREVLFIQLLESVTPSDARLLLDLKDKKIPNKIHIEIVEEAFPGLLNIVKCGQSAPPSPIKETMTRSEKIKLKWADPVWRARQIEIFKKRVYKKKEEKEVIHE